VAVAVLRVLSQARKTRDGARGSQHTDSRKPRTVPPTHLVPSIYLLSWGVAVFLGGAVEGLQYFGPRDADAGDFLRNVLGATAFLLVALALDRSRTGPWARRVGRLATLLAAVALLAVAGRTAIVLAIAYVQRDATFPMLCDFESKAVLRLTHVKDAELSIVARPVDCGNGRRAARVTLRPATYPSFGIREPASDWTGYETLAFDVYSELPEDAEMVLRIHDAAHDQDYRDRFNRAVVIHPGCNRIRVALSDVREAPRGRSMGMTKIAGVYLFAVRPAEPFTIYLDAFRLE
jgi:hypothetical protein